MAEFEWDVRYDYNRPGGMAYQMPGGEQVQPLTAWVLDYLGTTREGIRAAMLEIGADAEQTVRNLSRVDTGRMRDSVMHRIEERGDVIELVFGWDEGNPYYAPFQEFGTEHIAPMMAVHRAFAEARAELTRRIGGQP